MRKLHGELPVSDMEPVLSCIDMGTTRTRAWVTEGSVVWARGTIDAGVRDVAAGHSRDWLADRLRTLLKSVLTEASQRGLSRQPLPVLAAGMITSDQGLVEVPHVEAPAGIADLARNIHVEDFALGGGESLRMLFVPGVRSGFGVEGLAAIFETDLMRGEETLCVGLIEEGSLTPDTLLLNLGSHWKLIWCDSQKRIADSRTRLTGEMIHAIQAHTLLASSLPQQPPRFLDKDWVQLGFDQAARTGLSRALFCVRLLDLRGSGTGEQRLSFLYGAMIHGEMPYLAGLRKERPIKLLVAGPAALANICSSQAKLHGIRADVLSEENREQAYLLGLRTLYRVYAGDENAVVRGALTLPEFEPLKEPTEDPS
jgi:2-dehydro-3-deoxygalactonokinase